MKIVVVGLRGFPNIQGGVETHCEELFTRIAKYGHDVTVVRRKRFVKENPPQKEYKGIKFKDIRNICPPIPGFEAAIHTFWGIWHAYKVGADIVHIHAIGPAIMIPWAKLLGLKVVMTHHGTDYMRDKWGFFSKIILRLGERFAARYADEIVSISPIISDILKNEYHRTEHVHLIYNGITTFPQKEAGTSYIEQLGLQPGKYILGIGRFVQEKRFDRLIEAFIKLRRKDIRLVIAGAADDQSSYAVYLREMAEENDVIAPGIVKGDNLHQLFKHAALFVLPSSHEGLPITLLEAMGFGMKVLVSNIPPNKAVGLPDENYFVLDNIDDMVAHIRLLLEDSYHAPQYDLSKYNWDNIAQSTNEVYTHLFARIQKGLNKG